ncbi:hypothetical protein [Nitratidesulfovibrio sp.]|uniref:hypothetical protein n=1 Tax=Nitratidesulfovibrio sp. TaxID=2802297 RepID=UPI003342DB69
MKDNVADSLEQYGFAVVSDEDGMESVAYTATCSGSRSACCTRTCSANANFTENADAWDRYLEMKAGQVQY